MPEGWRLVVYRLPAEPSRHRVAVWRHLRKLGAVSLQQATWAVPRGTPFDQGLDRTLALVNGAGGSATVFTVSPDDASSRLLEEQFTADREAEFAEFLAECAKFDAEIDHEISVQKFTLAELDEEEHNLDRLRRWYRDLRRRALFGAPSANAAGERLRECGTHLEAFAAQVYAAREGSEQQSSAAHGEAGVRVDPPAGADV